MKIFNYIISILVLVAVFASCDKEILNPTLKDSDLSVYFYGQGGDPHGIAWEGFDVMVGDTLDLKMQVSPLNGTSVSWVAVNVDTEGKETPGSVINETMEYTFMPTEAGSDRVWFIASRSSTVADTVKFNLRGVTETGDAPGEGTSIINSWQNFTIPQGVQNGSFTAEWDMVAEKDGIDAVTGFGPGEAGTYSDLSVIVRFDRLGIIDAYNSAGYAHVNEVPYSAGVVYHVRAEINVINGTYSAYVTPEGGAEVVIAEDYGFRNPAISIAYWSMVAGDWNLANPGVHTVSNMVFSNFVTNENPVIQGVEDVVMYEGQSEVIQIKAIDPLGGNILLQTEGLPRFATYTETGNGTASISLNPYVNCGGCDVGNYAITILASNKAGTSDAAINIEVKEAASMEIVVSTEDGSVWGPAAAYHTDNAYLNIFAGSIGDVGPGAANICAVMPFELPVVPAGMEIGSAILRITTETNNSWVAVDYDLYALPIRTTATILGTDYFVGPYDSDANATGIQAGLIKNGDEVGEVTTSNQAGLDLAAYLNAQYAGGATAGQFVFLRVNDNRGDLPTWAHLQFKSGDTDIPGTEPTLIVTFSPI
ncbi:MAG: hypothetical protein ABFS32_14150 [Bacteroidota bacterium]